MAPVDVTAPIDVTLREAFMVISGVAVPSTRTATDNGIVNCERMLEKLFHKEMHVVTARDPFCEQFSKKQEGLYKVLKGMDYTEFIRDEDALEQKYGAVYEM